MEEKIPIATNEERAIPEMKAPRKIERILLFTLLYFSKNGEII